MKCGTVQIVVLIPGQEKQQMGPVPQERKQTPDNEHLSELTYLRHSSNLWHCHCEQRGARGELVQGSRDEH